MTFLTPIPAIVAAALALPALLLLYFLKLRRRPARVASTLLWLKSVEDLQVNAPFQRLRITLLFLLQLLMLLLFLLALARPVIDAELAETARLIILVDRSASMNAIDPGEAKTRLERAKDAALEVIGSLSRGEAASDVMVIAFGRSARVVSAFGAAPAIRRDAIRSLEPTDEAADLSAAIKLANAFALTASDESAALPDVLLISDGGVHSLPQGDDPRTLRSGRFEFAGIGPAEAQAVSNVGITALSARRDVDAPATLSVFIALANAGAEQVETTVSLRVDGELVQSAAVAVPDASGEDEPGTATRSFLIELPRGAVLAAAIQHDDALAADDTAWLIVPQPQSPTVLLVSPADAAPDAFLRNMLEAAPQIAAEMTSIDAYEADHATDPRFEDELDLIIFDRVSPAAMPAVSSVWFGAAPPMLETAPPLREGGRRALSWDRRHPLMRHVELDDLVWSGFGEFVIDPQQQDRFEVLASGPDGPVMVSTTQRGGATHVFIGFDLLHSNWPAQVSIAVFMQNVLDAVIFGGRASDGVAYAPGEPIAVEPAAGAATIEVRDLSADAPIAVVEVEGRDRVTLPGIRRAGLYRAAGAGPADERIAVNVANIAETDIRPREDVTVNAERIAAVSAAAAAPRELWPWLVAAALVLLVIEWLLYAARSRV